MAYGGQRPAKVSGYNPPRDAIANAILTTPITVMGESVSELKFRAGQFGDFRGMVITELDQLTFDDLIQLTAKLANIPLGAAESISMADLGTVGEAVGAVIVPLGGSEDSEGEQI